MCSIFYDNYFILEEQGKNTSLRLINHFPIFLGISDMVFSFGLNGGSGIMGLLFHAIGPKTTLFCYSIASAFILICLLAYIYFAKDLDDYEKLNEDKDGEEDKN